jgi:hypothetical protein
MKQACSNHRAFFERVASLPTGRQLFSPTVQELNGFTLDSLAKFQRKSPLQTTYIVGAGKTLARKCATHIREVAGLVKLPLNQPWERQWREITRSLKAFFGQAEDSPCLLWSHTVCWRDKAISQLFRNQIILNAEPELVPLPQQSNAKLYFEYPRRVSIDTSKIQWLKPRYGGAEFDLGKLVETRLAFRNGQLVASGHREALGAYIDSDYDGPWLRRSLFPGLKGRVHSLFRDDSGELTILPTRTENAGSDISRLVHAQAILDVQILKAWRLRERSLQPGIRDTMVDEVAFAMDRTGEMAYIATAWDMLETHVADDGEESWLADWLFDNRE